MPRKRTNGAADSGGNGSRTDGDGGVSDVLLTGGSGTTGRYLVLLRQDAIDQGVRTFSDTVGLKVTNSSEFDDGGVPAETLMGQDAIVFEQLGVAVVNAPPDQFAVLSAEASQDGAILAIEEERIVRAISEQSMVGILPPPPAALPQALDGNTPKALDDYLHGYQDAVNHLVERLLGTHGAAADGMPGAGGSITQTELTWGLQVTNVAISHYTGKGVKVAVLDTGFDLEHPDFIGRRVVSQSFIPDQAVQDGHGHGTHCIGTACGSSRPINYHATESPRKRISTPGKC